MFNQKIYSTLKDQIKTHKSQICEWLSTQESASELPLYTSVDIRNSGFKLSVVDTNLFPAGFNNLCKLSLDASIPHLRHTILERVPNCKKILIIAEEHTRNTFYLENVFVLQETITKSGFNVKVGTFLEKQPMACTQEKFIELETSSKNKLKLYCLKNILDKVSKDLEEFDMIILNNDLTSGIPEILLQTNTPIYPSIQAGWHSRLKSHHFTHVNDVIKEFSELIHCDPWLLGCLFTTVKQVSITEESDRKKLAEAANTLLTNIQKKYTEYGINEKPFLFLKSDSGTYGMGVMPIESSEDILSLNRKNRNKLTTGKSSKPIENFILQEGIPSINQVDNYVGEAVIYSVANKFVGGFYRLNTQKSDRENLNSQGMLFKKMCLDPNSQCIMKQSNFHADNELEQCGITPDPNIDIYRILARLSGIAASREVTQLEKNHA